MNSLKNLLVEHADLLIDISKRLKKYELPNPIIIKKNISDFPSDIGQLKTLFLRKKVLDSHDKYMGIYVFEVPSKYSEKVAFELAAYRERQKAKKGNAKSTPNLNKDHIGSNILYVGKKDSGSVFSRLSEHLDDPSAKTGALRIDLAGLNWSRLYVIV